jgi:competence protein ComGF
MIPSSQHVPRSSSATTSARITQSPFKRNIELAKEAISFVENLNIASINRHEGRLSIKGLNPMIYKSISTQAIDWQNKVSVISTALPFYFQVAKFHQMLQARAPGIPGFGLCFEKACMALYYLSTQKNNPHLDIANFKMNEGQSFADYMTDESKVIQEFDQNSGEIITYYLSPVLKDYVQNPSIDYQKGPAHAVLVIGRDPEASSADNPQTWTEDVIICDPWAKRIYTKSSLNQESNLLHASTLGQTKLVVQRSYPTNSDQMQYMIFLTKVLNCCKPSYLILLASTLGLLIKLVNKLQTTHMEHQEL